MTLTRARTIQYIGILLSLGLIAVGYWYFSVRAGVKTNSSALQPQGVGDLSAGLAGYWKLDEGSGTTAADASTNGNNGTFVGSPTWTTGRIGQGVTSFSTTTYVNVPHSAALNSLPFTLSFWVKTADSSAGRHIAIAKDYVDGYRCHVMSGAMRCWFITGGADWYDGGDGYSFGQVADNQWHLITMVISASGGVGYLDGVQAVSQSLTGSPAQAPTGTGALSIGTGTGGSPVDDFSGSLDEVRIYNRALSVDEVGQLYRLTTPTGVDTSLKGYWSFNADALSGTTVYDWSGAGKNLTLNNGPTAATGRVGQGLSFDGTNDYASGTYTPTGPNTLSAWIYPRSFADNPGIVGQLSPNYNSYGWGLSLDTSGNVHAISANDNITWYNNLLAAVPLNQWSHVTVTFSSCCNVAATGYLYINGVQVASYTGTADTYPYNFAIGARDNTSGTVLNYFNGSIDEVRIYNRALPAAEIKSLYDRGAPDKTNSSSSQAQGTGRLDSGLAGYWPLDNGSGTSATDLSTNGNTGTLTNGPTWTTGQVGGAVSLDGVDDNVTVSAGTGIINAKQDITLSVWVNLTSLNSYNGFIYKSGAGGCDEGTAQYMLESGLVGIQLWIGGSSTNSGVNPPTGQWSHILATNSAAGSAIYLNGALIKTGSALAAPASSSQNWTFGGCNTINGKIDEVRIYNRALSADEVSQLYRLSTPTGTDTSLKGYWSFNGKDLSGTTAYDRSGAGNDGTLTGGPTGVNGIIGQALSLDGTNDVVQITSDAPNITAALTASFWLKTTATSQKTILGFWQTTGWMVELDGDGSGPGKLSFYSNNSGYKYANTTVNDGNWHYVAFTLTSGGVLTIYRDGVADGSYSSVPLPGSYTDDKFFSSVPGGGRYFPGTLDEIRMYNRALTAAEIQGQYDTVKPEKLNSSATQAQGTGRLDGGLAGYWSLDNGSGTSATDLSTNANTGTLTNGPTWTTGQIGSAVDFDGTNDHIDVGSSSALNFTGPHTINAWIYPTGFGGDSKGRIVDRNVGSAGYLFFVNNSDITQGFSYGVNNSVVPSSTGVASPNNSITLNTWQMVTASFDGTNVVLYKNGVAVASGALDDPVSSGANFFIGGRPSANDRNFDGLIDEVRAYNRALSADEVSQLYRLSTPTGTDTSLKGYWSFNGKDLSGTTAYDRSGAGNNGTLTNGPTVVNGKIGQTLSFDGTDDYVDAGSASSLNNLTNRTVTAWIKQTNAGSGYTTIVGKAYGLTPMDAGWSFMTDPGGGSVRTIGLKANFATSDLLVTSQPNVFNYNEWTHVALTWDGSTTASNVKVYVNGVELSNYATQTNGSGAYSTDDGQSLRIGHIVNGNLFPGLIDEVRIYNRVLTAAEILGLYNQSR